MIIDNNEITDISIPDVAIPSEGVIIDDTTTVVPGTEDQTDAIEQEAVEEAASNKPNFAERVDDILDVSNTDTPDGDEEVSPDAEVFKGVAGILKDQGFFNEVEDFNDITDATKLAALFDDEVKSRLTDREKELQKYMNLGVDYTEVQRLQSAIDEVDNIQENQLEGNDPLSESLIKEDLKFQGVDDATATRLLDMIKKSGSLLEEGAKALSSRKGHLQGVLDNHIEANKASKEEAQKENAIRVQELRDKLASTEVFGRKVSKNTVDKLNSLATTTVSYTEDGRPLNALMKFREDNPLDFEHKLLYLFSATDGFKNLKTFDRSAESRMSANFKNAVIKISSSDDPRVQKTATSRGTVIDIDQVEDII